ncbi:MAG: M48 family metallopeptidase, partial [Bacilli bacterium]
INENNIMAKSMDDLNKWYSKQLKIIFTNRLDFNYHQFTEIIPYPNLKIRVMKSRWGVCNRKNNNVTLNANLLKQDITKLDYVIIHELAHFVHFNHSKSFWTVVNKYCPNYKKIRNSMKEW